MQIKASVAALMLAFAGTTAWAGTNDPEQNTAGPSSLDPAGAAAAQAPTGWQYMNGEPAADAGQGSAATASQSDTDEQAKTSLGFTEGDQSGDGSDQTAQAEEESDKMTGTDHPKGEHTSAASGDPSNDNAAMGDEDADRMEAAHSDEEGQEGQAATSDQSGDEDQAATSEESDAATTSQATGSDESVSDQYTAEQPGNTTQSEDSDESGMSEDQTGAPSSQGGDSADQPAHSPREPDSGAAMSEDPGSDQSAQAQDGQSGDQAAGAGTPAELQGKVVVIIPRDWEGSLEGLLSALQTSPDAKDIVIVQQGQPDDPQASSTEDPDDTYEANRVRPLNPQ